MEDRRELKLNGRVYDAEDLGEDRVRLTRRGYSVETTFTQLKRWQQGEFIQDVMPDEWTSMFGKEEP